MIDGRTWAPVPTGLPEGAHIASLESGARGYFAHVDPAGAPYESELWFSPDGEAWGVVRELIGGPVAIGAGDEGFVATGMQGMPEPGQLGEPFAIASSDGRQWFDATSQPPPADVVLLAPFGGDWLAASYTFEAGTLPD